MQEKAPFFSLPKLAHGYGDFAPFIDEQTMRIHHQKHHGAYVEKLNGAIATIKEEERKKTLSEWLTHVDRYGESIRNHGGGHYNHTLFWEVIAPPRREKSEPKGEVKKEIEKKWKAFSEFQSDFEGHALQLFGSGWTWLVANKKGELSLLNTANQDNPLMPFYPANQYPLFGIDLWEHAYYLTYQNRRKAYVEAFWKILSWERIEQRYIEWKKSADFI